MVVGERLLTVAQAAQVLHLSVAGTYGTIAEIKAVFGSGDITPELGRPRSLRP